MGCRAHIARHASVHRGRSSRQRSPQYRPKRFPLGLRGSFSRPSLLHFRREFLGGVGASFAHVLHRLTDGMIHSQRLADFSEQRRIVGQLIDEIVDLLLKRHAVSLAQIRISPQRGTCAFLGRAFSDDLAHRSLLRQIGENICQRPIVQLLLVRLFQPGDVFRILEPLHDFLISLDRQNHGDGLAVFRDDLRLWCGGFHQLTVSAFRLQ